MNMKKTSAIGCLLSIVILQSSITYADPTIVNNYNNGSPANSDANGAPPQNPGPYAGDGGGAPPEGSSSGPDIPPGAYTVKHGDGTSENIYTTGTKKPYIVEQYTNQNTQVSPYIYGDFNNGNGPVPPGPGPGPRPGPRR